MVLSSFFFRSGFLLISWSFNQRMKNWKGKKGKRNCTFYGAIPRRTPAAAEGVIWVTPLAGCILSVDCSGSGFHEQSRLWLVPFEDFAWVKTLVREDNYTMKVWKSVFRINNENENRVLAFLRENAGFITKPLATTCTSAIGWCNCSKALLVNDPSVLTCSPPRGRHTSDPTWPCGCGADGWRLVGCR